MRVKLLFWFVGISIVPLTIAAVLVYNQSSNIIRNGILNELNISGKGVEGKISSFIEGKKGAPWTSVPTA